MTAGNKSISISVVIPAYNAEPHIQRALESVLRQTSQAEEILVVDDGSTDRTADWVKGYGDKVKYLYQEHAGANEARNLGIQRAAADWIALLDADDEWLPEKLAVQREILEKYPALVWAYGNYKIVKADGTERVAHDRQAIDALWKEGAYFEDFFKAYSNRIPVHTITLLIKKSVLIEIGMFHPGQGIGHDPDVALRLAYRFAGVGYSDRPLATHYFGRPEGITQRMKNPLEEKKKFILRHLELSSAHGKKERFEPCAVMLLNKWAREMLGENPTPEVWSFVRQFRSLISRPLYIEAWLRCKLPRCLQGVPKGYKTVMHYLGRPQGIRKGYHPKRYWTNRHLRYGMDLQGVGNCTWSDEKNEALYRQARKVILEVCTQEKVDWKTVRMLDVGCGNGFYTALFRECGVTDYTGVDITDVLLPALQKQFPGYRFLRMDVTKKTPPGVYDLVVMIDVTQHIVQDRKFCRAMEHINACLKPGGLFVVTSWLSPETLFRQPHEVARPLEAYRRTFPDAKFSDPVLFRDKFLFTIRKPFKVNQSE